ncbi:hypothetical protein NPIL_127501 [Nephila pilipes]|uniref:C2H2-type domain-containing protein n=1 Tax=Nephila pilipes TaxID=299642 RepID=A0A8X6TCX4_NEPPI|nr:hypothetical protein NPIL_127501 [Nephila pilipes]
MDINNCALCKVKLEGNNAIRNHRCWIKTNENSVQYENFDRNIPQSAFKRVVPSANAFNGSQIDTKFATRINIFRTDQNERIFKISEDILKKRSERPAKHIIEKHINVNDVLCENYSHYSNIQGISDSNSQQKATIQECSTSKEFFSRKEEPLPLLTVPFPDNKNSYNFPPNRIYSIQGRLKDVIPNNTGLLESASEKIPNFNIISSGLSGRYSRRRSTSTVLPTFSEDEPFKCQLCSATFPKYGYLDRHNFLKHELRSLFECQVCCNKFTGWKTQTIANKGRHLLSRFECLSKKATARSDGNDQSSWNSVPAMGHS